MHAQPPAQWYRKAAERGYVKAQLRLGAAYRWGELGLEQDAGVGTQWYSLAAAQGDKSAQYMMGKIYTKGVGADKNVPIGMEWYLRAAEKNASAALADLGWLYHQGIEVVQDRPLAYAFYRLGFDGEDGTPEWARKRLLAEMTQEEIRIAEELTCQMEEDFRGALDAYLKKSSDNTE